MNDPNPQGTTPDGFPALAPVSGSTAAVLKELNKALELLNETFRLVGSKYTDQVMAKIYAVSDEIVRLSKNQSAEKP